MIRGVYTAVRAPVWTHEAFVRRWRLHGARAMAETHFWSPIVHYVQGDTILDRDEFGGAPSDIDGVGDIWWENEDGYLASLGGPDVEDVLADGAETLDQDRNQYITGKDVVIRASNVPAPIALWLFHRFDEAEAPGDWPAALLAEVERGQAASIHVGKAINREQHFDLYMELGFTDQAAASAAFARLIELTDPDTGGMGFATRPTIVPVWRYVLYDQARCLDPSNAD